MDNQKHQANPPELWTKWMREAIECARPYFPHPNPRVGALVITEENKTVGRGYHLQPGHPHAETMAIDQAGQLSHGSTLVVTLEPCAHYGRTGPCVEEIISAGIRRVLVGTEDPDPKVCGTGIARLQAEGIEVRTGIEQSLCIALDPAYHFHRRFGRAQLTLKMALTLDGQTAAADGTSQWITATQARSDSHRLRSQADAIMVGAGTLRSDNPLLTVRVGSDPLSDQKSGQPSSQPSIASDENSPTPKAVHTGTLVADHTPIPVVIAGAQPLPTNCKLWENPNTLVVSTVTQTVPAETIRVSAGKDGQVDLEETLVKLADRGLLDILCEGGPTLAGALWRQKLVDRGVWFYGARIGGGQGRGALSGSWDTFSQSQEIEITGVTRLGSDLRVDWTPA